MKRLSPVTGMSTELAKAKDSNSVLIDMQEQRANDSVPAIEKLSTSGSDKIK